MLKQDDEISDEAHLRRLIAAQEGQFREAFFSVLGLISGELTLATLASLLESGDVEAAVALADAATRSFGSTWVTRYVDAASKTSSWLGGQLRVTVDFDQTNVRAVRAMQENRLRLIREIGDETRAVIRQVLERGVQEGLNPKDVAREVRRSIGLTARQEAAVQNYARMLRRGDLEALTRRLRDRRFDPTVLRASRLQIPLTDQQITTMVARYRERYIAYRARVIARTEALRAAHEATEEVYRQAIDQGHVDPSTLIRQWNVRIDGREREWHNSMSGQRRALGERFVSGQGNMLRYPTDPEAAASETVQCRCVITTRMRPLAHAV